MRRRDGAGGAVGGGQEPAARGPVGVPAGGPGACRGPAGPGGAGRGGPDGGAAGRGLVLLRRPRGPPGGGATERGGLAEGGGLGCDARHRRRRRLRPARSHQVTRPRTRRQSAAVCRANVGERRAGPAPRAWCARLACAVSRRLCGASSCGCAWRRRASSAGQAPAGTRASRSSGSLPRSCARQGPAGECPPAPVSAPQLRPHGHAFASCVVGPAPLSHGGG